MVAYFQVRFNVCLKKLRKCVKYFNNLHTLRAEIVSVVASLILNLLTNMEVSGQLHAPAALLPRKDPQVLIEYESVRDPETV
jgi:hypothetical protein